MSQNELLLKIKGDSAGAKTAIAETRAAVAQLRSSFGNEMGGIQNATSKAFSSITDNLNAFVSQRIPLVGNSFVRLTGNIGGMASEAGKGQKELAALSNTINTLAQTTGKSSSQIASFLTSFVRLGAQAERDTAVIKTFGAVTAQTLIPQLERAGKELTTVAANSTAAGSGIAALAGPIGVAVVAVVALAVGAGLLTKGLFDLAVAAADFRGKMFDLSQQTGVAVETLSALEIAAKTTGGSIEGIAQSLVIFQSKLDEAQDSSSKAGVKFKELGISTNNTEEAFRDALTVLAKMPEGFHQTNEAAELFGRRGGKQVLAILKELDGDLDGAIAKFRELGLVISEEDAKAADEFNDQLAVLHFQMRALLGREVIPAALEALRTLSTLLQANREAIAGIGEVIGTLSNVILQGFLVKIREVNFALVALEAAAIALDRLRGITFSGVTGGAGGENAFAKASGGAGAPVRTGGGGGGAKAKRDEIYREALEASKEASAREIEEQRSLSVALEQAYELNLVNLTEYYQNRQGLIDENFNSEIDAINREQEALDAARARGRIKDEEANKKEAELTLRTIKAQNQLEEETNQLRIDRQKDRDRAEIELNRQLASIRATQREGELDRIKDLLDRQIITESNAIGRRQKLEQDAHNDRMLLLDLELKQITTDAERKIEINNLLIESEQKFTDEKKRLIGERIDALNQESAANAPGVGPTQDFDTEVKPGFDKELGDVPHKADNVTSAIGQLGQAIHANLTGDSFTVANAGLRTMVEVFGELGQAVGSAVQAFVLYGNAGTSVRKVTAEVLASIARMAATKAIFELAEGFAALAMAFFGIPNAGPSASAHFTAAAIYGSIAAVAAVAGRVTAGDSFTKQAGAGSSGSGSGGGSPSSTKPATREVDRRNSGSSIAAEIQSAITQGFEGLRPVVNVTMTGQATEGFVYMVENAAIKSARGNSIFRKIQNGEDV